MIFGTNSIVSLFHPTKRQVRGLCLVRSRKPALFTRTQEKTFICESNKKMQQVYIVYTKPIV